MRTYCTLFDSSYMAKGVAMIQSLAKHSSEPFKIYVLPMDEQTRWTLIEMELPGVVPLRLDAFISNMNLEEVKATRTVQEFCWTSASNLCLFLLEDFQCTEITYLDADLFFFSDPAHVFKMIGERSIAITPHRLIPSKKYLEVNGKFNVGWVTFKNTEAGRECLAHWASDCRDWCFNRIEDGKFGDQKYLDAWPERYGEDVCILDIGVNVAPWNIGQWEVTEGPRVNGVPIVCYHMHELQERFDGSFLFTNYDLRDVDMIYIYEPYVRAYQKAKELISQAELKLEGQRA